MKRIWFKTKNAWRRIRGTPWSPFDRDGNLRDDLLAVDADGKPNPKPNEGFYPIGALRHPINPTEGKA